MRHLSRSFNAYVVCVILVTAWLWALLTVYGVGDQRHAMPLQATLLALVSIIAYQFPVLLRKNWKLHVANSPLLAVALLYSSSDAMVIAAVTTFIGNTLLRVKWLPRPPQNRNMRSVIFNTAQTTLSMGLASACFHLIAGNYPTFDPRSAQSLIALPLAGIIAYVVNTGAVAGAVATLKGGNAFTIWREERRNDWLEETGLALLAIVTALVADEYPWAILLQAGSLAVVYLSFKNSAQVRSQTRMTIEHLATMVDRRDPYTYQHSLNVSRYAVRLGELVGLPGNEIELIRSAALVHDIGKIAVRDAVLLKNARLTDEEWDEMRQHPVVGADMVSHLPEYQNGLQLILHHHEAWDGSGYPSGFAGEQIPLGARILAVADSYDAMSTDRPYRKALSIELIVEQLRQGAGRQWDPRLVDLWLQEIDTTRSAASTTELKLVAGVA